MRISIAKVIGNMGFLIAVGCFFSSTLSHAELFQTAKTHKERQMAAGAFTQIYFSPGEFMLIGNFTYGVTDDFQAEARLGFGSVDPYFGVFGKYFLGSNEYVDLGVWGGIHTFASVPYVDLAFLVSHQIKKVTAYVHPLVLFPLKSGHDAGLAINPGVAFGVTNNISVYGELTLNIINTFSAISGGARYFF